MTNIEEDKLSMFIAINVVCHRFPEAVSQIAAFQTALNDLMTNVDVINNFYGSQQATTEGATNTKSSARETMQTLTIEIKGALVALAATTNDLNLKPKVDFPPTFLEKARDGEVGTICEQIETEARLHENVLITYGVNRSDINLLKDAIKAYRDTLGTPQVLRGAKTVATQSLKDAFKTGMSIVTERMDPLIPLLRKNNATFADEYEAQRKIISRVQRTKKDDPANPPLPPSGGGN